MLRIRADGAPRALSYLGLRCIAPTFGTSGEATFAFPFLVGADMLARQALLGLGLPPSAVARLFGQGRVLADGSALTPASRLASGQVVALVEPRGSASDAAAGETGGAPSSPARHAAVPAGHAGAPSGAVPAAPPILYEDDFVVAVDKPQGILVHGDGTGTPTLTDRVQALLDARAAGWPEIPHERVQAVQRLDVGTSGVVLFSKHALFQPLFDALLAGDAAPGRGGAAGTRDAAACTRAGKLYVAVVRGVPAAPLLEIDDPLGRDRHDARRMRVSPTGKPAFTQVEMVARLGGRWEGCSLVAVRIATGRRHQIRVHLAAHGLLVAGDALYGPDRRPASGNNPDRRPASSNGRAPSLMLHALGEEFVHPLYGTPVSIRSSWPARFPAPPVAPGTLEASLRR